MNKVKKAVIPAAGFGTRFLPATKAMPKEMLPIVDTPTIQFIVEEAIKSGIEDILIVTSTYKNSIIDHFDKSYELEDTLYKKQKTELLEQVQKISNMANIHFIRQKEALGLGHAILQAKAFVGNEPFAVLLGDDIVYPNGHKPALEQLIDVYNQTHSSVVGVQTVAAEDTSKYGIVDPKEKKTERNYALKGLVEKPEPSVAPSQMAVLGRYVLTPEIFPLLETQQEGAGNEIQLTDSIQRLLDTQEVYAYDFEGIRYDVGDKFGFIKATIDYAIRDEKIGAEVVEYINTISNK